MGAVRPSSSQAGLPQRCGPCERDRYQGEADRSHTGETWGSRSPILTRRIGPPGPLNHRACRSKRKRDPAVRRKAAAAPLRGLPSEAKRAGQKVGLPYFCCSGFRNNEVWKLQQLYISPGHRAKWIAGAAPGAGRLKCQLTVSGQAPPAHSTTDAEQSHSMSDHRPSLRSQQSQALARQPCTGRLQKVSGLSPKLSTDVGKRSCIG